MKRFQKRNLDLMEAKAKQYFDLQGGTFAKPMMKHSFIALALVAWTVSQSSALAANSVSRPADSKNPQIKVTVWVEKGTKKVNVDSKGVILKGYDVVAYFNQNKAVKGSPQYQTTYQGAIYYFSSAADLAAFKKDPARYAPQFGAFCANGVKTKALNDSDPTVFFIIKGKLYVCESQAAEKDFRSHEDDDVVTAERNWYQLIE
jgi:YHS domain-containing protein